MNNGLAKLGLQDFLRAGHVKRWHIVNTSREQTLAEHNYNVATIALALYDSIVGTGADHLDTLTLVLSALYHDAAEVRTGDIPTPGKRLLRHFGGVDMFEAVDSHIGGGVPFLGSEPRQLRFDNYVMMADHIDAAHFIRENGVGPRAQDVARGCWVAMQDLVVKLSFETGQDWAGAVNSVLAALWTACPRLGAGGTVNEN